VRYIVVYFHSFVVFGRNDDRLDSARVPMTFDEDDQLRSLIVYGISEHGRILFLVLQLVQNPRHALDDVHGVRTGEPDAREVPRRPSIAIRR